MSINVWYFVKLDVIYGVHAVLNFIVYKKFNMHVLPLAVKVFTRIFAGNTCENTRT